MTRFLDAILEPALWFAADWSLRWAVLIGVAALGLLLLRPRRAATRQLMYGMALLGGLLLPLAPRWGAGWHLTPEEAESPPLAKYDNASSFPRSAWERTSGRSASRTTREQDATPERRQRAFPRSAWERGGSEPPPAEPLGNRRLVILGLVLCWWLGVLVLLIRRLGGEWFLRRLRREAVDVQGPALEMFAACLAELNVRGAVRLAAHPQVHSPIVLGLFRPLILVPPGWSLLPLNAQRGALLHELAHVRRRDHWLMPLLETIRIAFFFHPPVRWLLNRLERERELLCDEMVVGRGIDRRDYARTLLEFARQSGRFALPPLSNATYLPMSRRRTVKTRINHLLEDDMERWMKPLPARWTVVLGMGLLALLLGLASFRVLAVEPEKPAPAVVKKKEVAKKPLPPPNREALRYGGKNFDQWRTELLTELKSTIRVDGMKAFAAFGANGYGPEATQAILEMMRGYDVTNSGDEDMTVVQAAYGAIVKIGASAVPALTAAVKEENRNVRRFALKALEGAVEDSRSVAPTLLQAMKHEDWETRKRAIEALTALDPLAKEFIAALIEALKNDDAPAIRALAATRLRGVNIMKGAKPAIPALLNALRDKESVEVRLEVLQTVQALGAGKKAVAAVSGLLQDEDNHVREYAYTFLQSLGADAAEAVPALLAALKEKKKGNYLWRQNAVLTLGTIGPAAKEAIPTLTALCGSDEPFLVNKARQALQKIKP